MDLDGLDASAAQAEVDEDEHEATEVAAQADTLATTTSSASRPGLLLGAEVPVPLLANEDAKSEEYHRTAGTVSDALELQQSLGAQQSELAHSTEEYKDLWMLCEYASKACERTGGRISKPGEEFNYHASHPNQTMMVNLHDLMPYLDDYTMGRHDPFVEDFIWSMDDSRHMESICKELAEANAPLLHIFADRSSIQPARSASSMEQQKLQAGIDSSRAVLYSSQEIKRNRRGVAQG